MPPGGSSKKGMQLGASKPNKASGMLEAIRADEGIPDASMDEPLIPQGTIAAGSNIAGVSTVVAVTSASPRAPQGP